MQQHTLRSLNSLRWAILVLAIFSLVVFLARYAFSGVEFRYWFDGLAFSFLLIVASAFTLSVRRLLQVFALLLTLPMVLWFCYVAVKVHGILPSSPAEQVFQRDAASWREFLWTYPDVLLQYVLAFAAFIVTSVDLIRSIRKKNLALNTGG